MRFPAASRERVVSWLSWGSRGSRGVKGQAVNSPVKPPTNHERRFQLLGSEMTRCTVAQRHAEQCCSSVPCNYSTPAHHPPPTHPSPGSILYTRPVPLPLCPCTLPHVYTTPPDPDPVGGLQGVDYYAEHRLSSTLKRPCALFVAASVRYYKPQGTPRRHAPIEHFWSKVNLSTGSLAAYAGM
ncbi:hypothetical protein J6590_057103 [Homalodisca vitripennis]|nr:hypothetical protein J6590_057103 [Homalodisca vitripennis]